MKLDRDYVPEGTVKVSLSDRVVHTLFTGAMDGMVIADDDGLILDVNPVACQWFRANRDAIVGRNLADIVQVTDGHGSWATLLSQSQHLQGHAYLERDGIHLWEFDYTITLHLAPHQHLVVLRDVTEQRQLKRQVQQLRQQLQQREMSPLSDRHQLERTLQASQQKYQTLFEILPIGVSITDAAGNLMEANPASERILGISVNEHTQRSYDEPTWQILHPDGHPMAKEEYASVRALRENRAIADQEQGIICPDGTVRWISVSATPLPVESYGVVITYVDMTLQKQTELALRHQEAQYHRATRAGHVGVWDWNLATQEIYLDPILKEMLGYQDSEIRNHLDDWGRYVYPEDQPTVMQAAQEHLAGHTPEYYVEHRMVHRDGSLRWFLARGVALRSPDGTPYRMLGTDTDITDHKRVEAALYESNAYYQSLADALPQCLYRKDRQGRCTFANRAFLAMTGHSLDQLLGKTVDDLYPPDLAAKYAADDAWVMENGIVLDTVETHRHPTTGDLLYVQVVKSPVWNEQGEIVGTQGIFWDVSDRQAAEIALRQREQDFRTLVENLKRAQEALMRLADHEHTLWQITQHIRETLDLNAILATTVQEVQRTLNADRTLIFRLNSDRSGVVTQEAVRPEYPMTLEMRWEDECFPAACYAFYCQGQPRIVSNTMLDDWGECLADFMQQTQVKSKMVAPIPQTLEDGSTHVWGLLITHACQEQRVWTMEEADLLQQVAHQLAIALHQSQLYQQVQDLNTTLEQQVKERTAQLQQSFEFEAILNRITERLRDSLDEQRILDSVITELAEHLGISFCNIALYDPHDLDNADEATSIVGEYNQRFPELTGLILSAQDFPEIEQQLRNNLQFQVCLCLGPYQRRVNALLNPMVDEHGLALGDILLLREPDQTFELAELKLVQQVANQCAIALRQSRLYQEAQAQVTELERLNRLKDDFLSTVSHELRSPMANIKVATDLLEIQLTQLGLLSSEGTSLEAIDNPLSRYFQILKEEGQREISLINDLLDLARLDADTEPLLPITIHLQSWIPHLLERFVTHTQQQQQHLTIDLPADLPPITTDPSHLQRILAELMTNACKYTPADQQITVSARLDGAMLELQVSNSGIEIPPVECDRIFDRFYRIPNADPWKHGGTGLGLALVKKLVDLLQGSVWAECGDAQLHLIVQLPLHLKPSDFQGTA